MKMRKMFDFFKKRYHKFSARSGRNNEVIIFAPQIGPMDHHLFSWISDIKGLTPSDMPLVAHLDNDAAKALFFYGEPPVIGGIELFSDEMLPLLGRKLVYQVAGQVPSAINDVSPSAIVGYLGHSKCQSILAGDKAQLNAYRDVALSGVASLLEGDRLSTAMERIRAETYLKIEHFVNSGRPGDLLGALFMQQNLDSLSLWGDPNGRVPRDSTVLLVTATGEYVAKRRVEIVEISPVVSGYKPNNCNWLDVSELES